MIQDTAPSRLPLTRRTVKTASATLKAASKLNADDVLPKLEAADIIVSELGHFKDNHTSEQALVNGFMSPITYPNGDRSHWQCRL